ncbi:hypothetical protein EYF80_012247 [Liparis tanakae]|uniref:Uncharacterized protein n=1 Tax=Liparis tanakae TaxID=230148 RepID=A0A4Z2IJV0_9TELE|nr:hypothetical protein EYF80_012247 [Liparis tanakae]
MGASLLPS